MPPVPKLSWQPDKIFQVQTHLFTLTSLAVKTLSPGLQVHEKDLINPGHKYIEESLLLWEKASCLPGQRWGGSPVLQGTCSAPLDKMQWWEFPAMMGKWLLILSFQGATPKILWAVKWFQGEGVRRCGVGGEIRLFRCYELIIAKRFTWRLKGEQKILD